MLEYLPGGDLDAYLESRKEPMTEDEIKLILK
jgi:hypothetical protein